MAFAGRRAPWHLWAVGVVATLFNAIGVFDFVMVMARGEDYMASAGMSPGQIAYYRAIPGWVTAVWAIGVFAALAGALLLLARRRAAVGPFVVSLAAFALNLVHMYRLSDGGRVMGTVMAITSAVIAGQLALLAWYARAMTARGILR